MTRTVLLIDDSADIRLVMKSYLELWTVTIDEADTGTKALQMIQSQAYDLVFVDLIMPGMDGPELIQELRAIEKRTGRPRSYVVVLSGSVEQDEWQRAQQAGMDSRLDKPIAMRHLEKIMGTSQ